MSSNLNNNNNKQQQQEKQIYSHSSSYSSTSEICLEDLLQPLGEPAIPIEEDITTSIALTTMLITLNAFRSNIIALPESFSPYSSPPPPIFDYSYSNNEIDSNNKGNEIDYDHSNSNLYFQPRYSSSSGSSTPGSIMSYTSSSSGTTSPRPTTFNSTDFQRNYPYSSPTLVSAQLPSPSPSMTRTKSETLTVLPNTLNQQAREAIGLVGNFGGISPSGGKISSNSRESLVEEIEGISLRVKVERNGFAF